MSATERHPARHRAIFLSDIHLGTRGCQAELLLDFLKRNECDQLYLVGDIVDGWRLKRWWYWPQAHNDVVQKIMRKARKGTDVVYIAGNHDEAARQYFKLTFGGVRVEEDAIHLTPDGRKLLVIHGDQFDGIVRYARWLAILGDWAYASALRLNTMFNWARRKLGLPYWSLSAFLKHRVKNAVQYIDNYEHAVAAEARRRGVDGVVCGRRSSAGSCPTRHLEQRSRRAQIPGMAELNHLIVWSKDKHASAEFLADILGVPMQPDWDHFVPVKTGNGVTLDFIEAETVRMQHYAFLVSDAEFDAGFAKIKEQGIRYWAEPSKKGEGEINRHFGGRGVYFEDPNGHLLELITKPYGEFPG